MPRDSLFDVIPNLAGILGSGVGRAGGFRPQLRTWPLVRPVRNRQGCFQLGFFARGIGDARVAAERLVWRHRSMMSDFDEQAHSVAAPRTGGAVPMQRSLNEIRFHDASCRFWPNSSRWHNDAAQRLRNANQRPAECVLNRPSFRQAWPTARACLLGRPGETERWRCGLFGRFQLRH